MTEALMFLAPAFAMCVVIASLHVYLGMHILAREIIFVDLALAQLAALGATLGSLLSPHEEGTGDTGLPLLSFAFTLFGAALFAWTRRARRHVSQEAVVGIVYAVASAVMVLVLSRAPHGAEQLKDVLVGSLLLSDWGQVSELALAYLGLGAVEWMCARRFILISWHPEDAEKTVAYVTWWDFGFYVLFGIVITLSVRVAGVLLVFSYLIVPAVITRLFTQAFLPRLLIGWAVALAASVLGLWASWAWDVPTGAAVVAACGAVLVTGGLVRVLVPIGGEGLPKSIGR